MARVASKLVHTRRGSMGPAVCIVRPKHRQLLGFTASLYQPRILYSLPHRHRSIGYALCITFKHVPSLTFSPPTKKMKSLIPLAVSCLLATTQAKQPNPWCSDIAAKRGLVHVRTDKHRMQSDDLI